MDLSLVKRSPRKLLKSEMLSNSVKSEKQRTHNNKEAVNSPEPRNMFSSGMRNVFQFSEREQQEAASLVMPLSVTVDRKELKLFSNSSTLLNQS
nr:hypothetical protein Iba_chr01bCG6750 [Ipomoea batatas]